MGIFYDNFVYQINFKGKLYYYNKNFNKEELLKYLNEFSPENITEENFVEIRVQVDSISTYDGYQSDKVWLPFDFAVKVLTESI